MKNVRKAATMMPKLTVILLDLLMKYYHVLKSVANICLPSHFNTYNLKNTQNCLTEMAKILFMVKVYSS